MSLTQGVKLENTKKFIHSVHKKNYHRLLAWLNVGSDVENGYWAMFGARQGCYMTNCTDWDYVNVRDFKWLNQFWEDQNATLTEDRMKDEVEILGEKLKSELDIPVSSPLDPIQSKFFKIIFPNIFLGINFDNQPIGS